MNIKLFNMLPNDVIRHIVTFLDIVRYHNGEYVCTISKNDFRYTLIENLTKPTLLTRLLSNNDVIRYMLKLNYHNGFGCIIYYYFNNNTRITTIVIKRYIVGKFRQTWRQICENQTQNFYIFNT